MNFIETLNTKLDDYYLLKHPLYQAWNAGSLELTTLQTYAKEYYQHVAAFPRYVSGIHCLCDDLPMRQILLNNLIDEEQGEDNHPELWQRFAEELGVTREELQQKPKLQTTQNLISGYFAITKTDFASGLGALYAYERQTPEVSKSKIAGLREHYGIKSDRALQFFNVHIEADAWHSAECATLINNLKYSEQKKAAKGAEMGARLLWNFLDGILATVNEYCCN